VGVPEGATANGRRLRFAAVPTDVPRDVILTPLTGEPRSFAEWTTNFHLAMVVLDPFTYESAWILETAGRVLRVFAPADCRACFLVAATADEARQFLGPWAKELLTIADPQREVVKALGLETLPAFLHINQQPAVEGVAEGWDPLEWREVADQLARYMGWSRPNIPTASDPGPYAGTPALG
jgi:hypothetical protein